ncbi:hypothetical protein HPB47_011252 [Ixodes persulcatus]|uniref:Uncharacterized protein n=1 Tax=Ixodes persulcatus TaxID=34615 RepID=A0AC60NX41_IXOPE|nr:hypothetical protein HPB47_011252 [Ixodes persulcatus]
MAAFPNMDWDRELRLCNLLLEQDERNFNGWDYRRLVCQHAKVTLEKELSFTMDKIAANFSNYSAWHYRSSLLPKVHAGSREGTVKEDVLLEEYSLVQNATFTDPGDQSGWFYHRWLTGRGTAIGPQASSDIGSLSLLISERPALDFLLFCVSKETRTVTLHLTQQIRIEEVELTVRMNGVPLSCELSAARTSVLEKELEVCQALHELEPQNKWPLLTCVLLMRALDGSGFREGIEKFLVELLTIDPMRSAFYQDLTVDFRAGSQGFPGVCPVTP